MEIRIFGPGCARCAETEAVIREVAAARGGGISVQKVSDLREMMAAGVLSTPAVVIDGVVKAAGRVPRREEVAAWIEAAIAGAADSAASCSGSGCCCGGKR